jgi:hypothetical protein
MTRRGEKEGHELENRMWIIVCENFHGAVGPIPTQELARKLATAASEMGECHYAPVELSLAIEGGVKPRTTGHAKRGRSRARNFAVATDRWDDSRSTPPALRLADGSANAPARPS